MTLGPPFRTFAIFLACASSAVAADESPATRGALKALSDGETRLINESGCEFGFGTSPRETLVFGLNDTIMIRAGAKLSQCAIDPRKFAAFAEGRGSVSCGGRKLTLRRVGRVTSSLEADSATFPAVLTVSAGSQVEHIRGMAGTAC